MLNCCICSSSSSSIFSISFLTSGTMESTDSCVSFDTIPSSCEAVCASSCRFFGRFRVNLISIRDYFLATARAIMECCPESDSEVVFSHFALFCDVFVGVERSAVFAFVFHFCSPCDTIQMVVLISPCFGMGFSLRTAILPIRKLRPPDSVRMNASGLPCSCSIRARLCS